VIHEVNRVGGKLTFESEKGQGTTFFMEFPAPYQLEVMAIFRYQDRTFALPTRFVRGIVLDPELIELEFGTARLKGDDETYTLLALRDIDRNSSVENFRPLILLELAGAPCALMVDAYCAAQSIFVLPLSASQDLPVYLRGAATDANWGAIYCIDCVELERNLNVYIPEPEDTTVKTFAPLQGQKDSPEIQDAVLSYIAMQVDEVKDTMDPIEDPDELHYLVAIAYTQFKTKWIQYNSKMNYMIEAGLEPTVLDIYKTSSLSHLLDLLEPLTHPDAVRAVTMTLGQTIRELHAA
jgi:hypothetical protein